MNHAANRGRRTLITPERGLIGVALMGLLVVTGIGMLAASSWNMGGWGGGHMSRMMGGGSNTAGEPARQGGAGATVIIEDYAYSPGNLQVSAGASVTWKNRDSAPHSATANNRSWDTGVLAKGQSATLTFDSPGTFDYFCSVHPNMKARLVVQ